MIESALILAFLDANVLYQTLMRDILLQAAEDEVFWMHWSRVVREEVLRAFRRSHTDAEILRFERNTMARMDTRFDKNLVFGFEALETTFRLPDPDDHHVLAAANLANCEFIVTENLKDFPEEVCDRFGIEVLHPDDFLLVLLARKQDGLLESARSCRLRMKNPPMDTQEYLSALRRNKLPNFADALRFHARHLA